jgi:hypothetical protein
MARCRPERRQLGAAASWPPLLMLICKTGRVFERVLLKVHPRPVPVLLPPTFLWIFVLTPEPVTVPLPLRGAGLPAVRNAARLSRWKISD